MTRLFSSPPSPLAHLALCAAAIFFRVIAESVRSPWIGTLPVDIACPSEIRMHETVILQAAENREQTFEGVRTGREGICTPEDRAVNCLVTLPLRPFDVLNSCGKPSPLGNAPMSALARILVVAHTEVLRDLLTSLFLAWGYDAKSASDATKGLKQVCRFKPDIVLAQRQVRPIDGLELLQTVQVEYPSAGLFLIDCDERESEPKSIRLGVINRLNGPIEPETLKAQLRAFLDGRQRPLRPFVSHSSIRILVVDDNADVRGFVRDVLSNFGFKTDTADDGFTGLKKIQSFRPDVVVSDMSMGKMDGLEFFEKTHAKNPGIGFFFLTGLGSIQDAVRAMKLGAVGFLEKPFRPSLLMAELQAYLDSRQPPLRAFLCHSSADKRSVHRLFSRLRKDGIDAWIDDKQLIPGQTWELEIKRAIRESDVAILCLSQGAVTKEGYVQKEIRMALEVADEKPDETIFLIPAKLEECRVPDRLTRWQWVNLFESKGYSRLLNALRKRAGAVPLTVWEEKKAS